MKKTIIILMSLIVLNTGFNVNAQEIGVEQTNVEQTSAEQITIKQEQLNSLSSYFSAGITLVFPDGTEHIEKETLLSFLQSEMVSEDGTILWNGEQIGKVASEICTRHLSGSGNLIFRTTMQSAVSVSSNNSWNIDVVRTVDALKIALVEKRGTVTAAVIKPGTNEDLYYLPSLYVEVSTGAQHLWVYKDGILIMESPVTTGKADSQTNLGVHKVSLMQTNRILMGVGYALPVSYWMKFNSDSEGFHDATWRNDFGTTDWLADGSHGCVNMPLDKAGILYSLIKVGTPVIIY